MVTLHKWACKPWATTIRTVVTRHEWSKRSFNYRSCEMINSLRSAICTTTSWTIRTCVSAARSIQHISNGRWPFNTLRRSLSTTTPRRGITRHGRTDTRRTSINGQFGQIKRMLTLRNLDSNRLGWLYRCGFRYRTTHELMTMSERGSMEITHFPQISGFGQQLPSPQECDPLQISIVSITNNRCFRRTEKYVRRATTIRAVVT